MSLALFAMLWTLAPPDWTPVWKAAGVTRSEARVDLETLALYGQGDYRLPLFDYLMADPQRVPETAGLQLDAFRTATGVADALGKAAWLTGQGVRRGLVDNPVAAYQDRLKAHDPLTDAIALIRSSAHASPGTIYDDPPVDELPEALQTTLGLLLIALEQAARWREEAFANAPAAGLNAHLRDLVRYATLDRLAGDTGTGLEHQQRLDRLVAAIDGPALQAAAMDVALVIDHARATLQGIDSTGITTRAWRTPWGPIILGGPGPDEYDGEQPLLIVELGGDDRYSVGAAAAASDRPVAVLIDLAGNDQYLAAATEPASWGAGIGGFGFLIDESGDDVYEGTDATQGFGLAGVGVLWDQAGHDQYRARVHAEGAAAWGTGLLYDGAGNDRYNLFQRGQGYGFCRGAGVLCDVAGNDQYVADDTTIDFPSPQTNEHNTSLAQGFGFGRRADYTAGHSLAGGAGLLLDGEGDDLYQCGVFGQGAGYWFGVGLLADGAGADRYEGVWYVQAASAHFAIGGLYDRSGDDRYVATMNMALGAGHDFSLGYFWDEAGNDDYTAPNLSLGAGNANGVGYFYEAAGDDTYVAKPAQVVFGRARIPGTPEQLRTSARRTTRCLGFFLDAGGQDTYPERVGLGNGLVWSDQEEGKASYGAGADR